MRMSRAPVADTCGLASGLAHSFLRCKVALFKLSSLTTEMMYEAKGEFALQLVGFEGYNRKILAMLGGLAWASLLATSKKR